MEPGQTSEKREKQIAPASDVKKKHGKKWREVRPESLRRAMTVPERVSKKDIKAIIAAEYSDPVISLYLSVHPLPKKKALLRMFHSMKTHAIEERREYIESLAP